MKKSILSIGTILSKAQQLHVNGGGRPCQNLCPAVLKAGDYCRTGDCVFGQCDGSGFCIPI